MQSSNDPRNRARSPEASISGSRNGSDPLHAANPGGVDTEGLADMNGRRRGDEGYNPFNTVRANETHQKRQEAEAAAQAGHR